MKTRLLLVLGMAAGLLATTTSGLAVTITGTDTGIWSGGTGTPPPYTPTAFSGNTDASGYLALTFGTFTPSLGVAFSPVPGGTFTLNVSFSAPVGASGPSVFGTTSILGTITSSPNGGGLTLNFPTTPVVVTYPTNGAMNLFVSSVDIQYNQTSVDLTGRVQIVPDAGSTVMLFGSGLLGLALFMRRFSRK